MLRDSSNVGLFAVVDPYDFQWYVGVSRACGTVKETKCFSARGVVIPEVGVKNATGSFCYCTGDLCNFSLRDMQTPATTASALNIDPPIWLTSAGGIVVSFNVASLLALTAARFLSQ